MFSPAGLPSQKFEVPLYRLLYYRNERKGGGREGEREARGGYVIELADKPTIHNTVPYRTYRSYQCLKVQQWDFRKQSFAQEQVLSRPRDEPSLSIARAMEKTETSHQNSGPQKILTKSLSLSKLE